MRIFIDLCVPRATARAIAALSCSARLPVADDRPREKFPPVLHYDDVFSGGSTKASLEDWDWLPKLAEDGDWVAVTSDANITKRLHEQRAWLDSGLTAFFLPEGLQSLPFWEQATFLVRHWPAIVVEALLHPKGRGFRLTMNGKIDPINMQQFRDNLAKREKQHGDKATRRATADRNTMS